MTPKSPPPQILLSEWDGMVRIAFLRKNKTLSANFKTKSVLKMLEANYNTYKSMSPDEILKRKEQQQQSAVINLVTDEMEEEVGGDKECDENDIEMKDDLMDTNENNSSCIKERVLRILKESGLDSSRACKMDQHDFIK